jgi:hypothetical protein
MNTVRCLVLIPLVTAVAPVCQAEELDDMLVRCRKAEMVVVGRVTAVHSCKHPLGMPGIGTIATATISIERYLKGKSDVKTIEVVLRCESNLELTTDDEDVIWFLRERQPDGRHLVEGWKWGVSETRYIESALRLVDRKTRILGMPEPKPADQPVSVVLGVPDGSGKALTSTRVGSFRNLRLLVQFENHKSGSRSVMPCLHGSDIRWRYPYYDLEIVDADGNAVPRGTVVACRSVGAFSKLDIVPLEKGEVFRGELPMQGYDRLPYAKYRMRLHYTSKQDATIKVSPDRQPSAAALTALKTVWEGSITSNWIEVEIGIGGQDR